jgi:renalase
MIKQQSKIAVIGAGISGLACATKLQNAGLDVTVFEKSRGVSGRMSTRVNEGWQCDHGAQYFTASNAQFAAEVQRWHAAGVAKLWQPRLQMFDGTKFTEKTSLKDRYMGVPRQTSPAKFLAQNLNLLASTTINKVELINNQWQLSSKEQGAFNHVFDALILAIPAPQAKVILEASAPKLAQVAASVAMQGCWTLMCCFESKLELPFNGLFVQNSLLSWVARDSAKPGRILDSTAYSEIWVLHASSKWSEIHIDENANIVAEKMITEFIKLGGSMPQGYATHLWRYAECANYSTLGCAWDNEMQVGLCGDWLNGGKVQGAWLSGQLLAEQLLQTEM